MIISPLNKQSLDISPNTIVTTMTLLPNDLVDFEIHCDSAFTNGDERKHFWLTTGEKVRMETMTMIEFLKRIDGTFKANPFAALAAAEFMCEYSYKWMI